MTRFFGKVGYVTPVRSGGVTEDVATERPYGGEELRNTRYFATEDTVLGKVSFQTRLSIVADAYALENFKDIRYVEWAGSYYNVDQVDVERPRLILVVGEKYNGPTAPPEEP
jgi:hypothetical protein